MVSNDERQGGSLDGSALRFRSWLSLVLGAARPFLFLASRLSSALVEGSVPRLLQIMPITWVAGSLVGVSMGIGWARSFIDDPAGSPTTNKPMPASPSKS